MLKISIITITYNSEAHLEETMKSVLGQDFDHKYFDSTDRTGIRPHSTAGARSKDRGRRIVAALIRNRHRVPALDILRGSSVYD